MKKRGSMKSVYVVKSAPKEVDEKHKEMQKKSVYLLKSDEQAINRYRDLVIDFVEELDGLFLVVSQDKTFFQNFRNSFYKELQIDLERIRIVTNSRRAQEEVRVYKEYQKQPFLFIESEIEGQSSLPFIEEFKGEFPDVFVIILMTDIDERMVAQFVEVGADSFITKPVSVNVLIEKIANTLEPPDLVGKMVREGKERLRKVEFALAYGVARDILKEKPGSPAGLMIMGDALKGLSKRDDALKMYLKAMENAPLYLEPLKKIVDFYKEDGNQSGALRYLVKIDELSPMHIGRKKELGELAFMNGDVENAAKHYEEAIKLAHAQKLPECVQMAEDYGDKIFNSDPIAACRILEFCTRLASIYRVDLHWSIYNRLGMVLRKQKRWEAAVDAYVKAAQLAPKDESILFNMGMAYVEGKDFGSAAQKFERAIELNSAFYKGNLSVAYVMGQVFIKANRTKNAILVLNHVYSQDQDYKNIKALLKSLS